MIGAGGAALSAVRCGDAVTRPSPVVSTTTATGTSAAACAVAPPETLGPYPSLTNQSRQRRKSKEEIADGGDWEADPSHGFALES
jgi:hypothetical protein